MGGAELVDITKGEMVEAELNTYITRADKRRRETEGEREREELYMESVRRHHGRQQRELAWAWLRFHERQLNNRRRVFALLEAHDLAEIRRYEQMLNIDYQGGDAA